MQDAIDGWLAKARNLFRNAACMNGTCKPSTRFKIALVDGYFDEEAPEGRQQLHGSVHCIVCLVSMGAFEELGEVAGGCVVIMLSSYILLYKI